MNIFKIKVPGEKDIITIAPPQIFPGFIVFQINEEEAITMPASDFPKGFTIKSYTNRDKNYDILKASLKKKDKK